MRLIGTVESEKQAFRFYSYLLKQGINTTYEPVQEKKEVSIWVYDEEMVGKALSALEAFNQNPDDPKYQTADSAPTPPEPPDLTRERKIEEEGKREQRALRPQLRVKTTRAAASHPLTIFVIVLCVALFFWNSVQQAALSKADGAVGLRIGMTPVMQKLMFDYPESNKQIDHLLEEYSLKSVEEFKALPQEEKAKFQAAENIPTWHGVLAIFLSKVKKGVAEQAPAPMFTSIKTGQLWRLFTPTLLHAGFLHILFNMAWAWILLKQLESRLPKWKIILIVLLIGITSNVAQYLVSGPYFLGFSGVVCGLVGFIWVRQKVAPWEGYPLQKMTIIFILVFVLAMFVLELFSLILSAYQMTDTTPQIANTAHIIGGLAGALLARIPIFARGLP
ncbi:MAG: Rhomboid protease GlpG [Chlamydiae bacterium]|nr:Rhomboid protease GlpG [Chlamydiota bacterium]